MAIYEVRATITYDVTVDVEGDNPDAALRAFDMGSFREVYLDRAEMTDWTARSTPTEVEFP